MKVEPVRLAAPAKVNLYLHVTGRRADGYHLIDSLIAFADIHDTIIAEPAEELSLRLRGPYARILAKARGNLVLRAARGLAEACGVSARARLTLVKRLPPASGLGGGSSDAASALRALCALWNVVPARGKLDDLALALGADVPACLGGVTAAVSGIGETVEPTAPLPETALVLVNPGRPVSTRAVFKAFEGGFSAPAPIAEPLPDAEALAMALRARENDLAAPAARLEPAIGECLGALGDSMGCLLARMSGSGASCFGLFRGNAEAQAAAAGIAEAHPRWWVRAGRLVNDVRGIVPGAPNAREERER